MSFIRVLFAEFPVERRARGIKVAQGKVFHIKNAVIPGQYLFHH